MESRKLDRRLFLKNGSALDGLALAAGNVASGQADTPLRLSRAEAAEGICAPMASAPISRP